MPERILFVVPYVPNLIRVRPYNLIRALARRGNRITLLTLWSDEAERQSLAQLDPYVERAVALRLPRWRSLLNCLAALPGRRPLQAVYCWEPALANQAQALLQPAGGELPFDAAHVEHLRGAVYGQRLAALARRLGRPLPVVWDSVDSISLLFRQAMTRSRRFLSRSLTRFELGRTRFWEARLVSQFEAVTVTSSLDRNALIELLPPGARQDHLHVLPNGVDLDTFRPPADATRLPATLVVSGKMSYHANVTMVLHLAQEILPRVWASQPEVRLQVVGKDPGPELLALAKDPRIEVTGTVAHLPPYLQAATVAVAPIAYGAGIQNKVLEAMACAAPVVASAQAVAALETVAGRDLRVAATDEEFAGHVLALLADPDLRRELGQAGRAYVERNHNWDVVAGRFEALYAAGRASPQDG